MVVAPGRINMRCGDHAAASKRPADGAAVRMRFGVSGLFGWRRRRRQQKAFLLSAAPRVNRNFHCCGCHRRSRQSLA